MPNASTFTVSVVPSKGVMPSPQAAHDGANNLKKKIIFFREIIRKINFTELFFHLLLCALFKIMRIISLVAVEGEAETGETRIWAWVESDFRIARGPCQHEILRRHS